MAGNERGPKDETLLEVHGGGPRPTPPPAATPGDVPATQPDAGAVAAAGAPAGERLGPYELRGELGRGGMGAVYRAYRPELKREYALKVILPGAEASAEVIARFRREAQAAAGLSGHPGIVGVHDIGEADGRHYFAMDLIAGRSLEDLVDGRPASAEASARQPASDTAALTPQRAAAVVEQAAVAVHFAHTRGILHRDLKPANIMIDAAGVPWVADFGLATLRDSDAQSARLTKSGAVLGTPAYMPPEQARGDALDVRADVYSLGATLYEALVGEPPFTGDSVYSVLAHVMRDEPKPPAKRNPFVPRDLDTIVLKCLEKDRERRYASAADLAEDLRRYREHQTIAARPATPMDRLRKRVRRNPAPWAVGTILGAVVIGLLFNFWFRGWKAERQRLERGREFGVQATAAEEQSQWQAAAFLWVRAAEILGADRPEGVAARHRADHAQAEADRAALLSSVVKLMEIGTAQVDFHALHLGIVQDAEAKELAARLAGTEVDAQTAGFLVDGRRALEGDYTAAVAALQGARAVLASIPEAPQHREALEALAAMAWSRLVHAEARGLDEDAKRFLRDTEAFEELLAGIGHPQYAERLRGDGTLTLDTVPSGATVECRRFRPRSDGRWEDLPYDPTRREFQMGRVTLGTTPLRAVSLPMGSYLLIIRSPGKRDTRYPVLIERNERDVVQEPIPLFTDAEIGEGFVYVPAGDTWSGGDPKAYNDWPRHRRWVPGFLLGEREVTMRQYYDFLRERLRSGAWAPERVRTMFPRTAPDAGFTWRVIGDDIGAPRYAEGVPAMMISWTDATAYCEWLGERTGREHSLPLESEWVRAATGADGRRFIWGDTFRWEWTNGRHSPMHGAGEPQPSAVGSVAGDVSVFGVRDLGGNAREWMLDAPAEQPLTRAMRGGAFSTAAEADFRVGARHGSDPEFPYTYLGFRVRAELPKPK